MESGLVHSFGAFGLPSAGWIATGSLTHAISSNSVYSIPGSLVLRMPSTDYIVGPLTARSTLLRASMLNDSTLVLKSVPFKDSLGKPLDTIRSRNLSSLQTWLLGKHAVGFIYSPTAKLLYAYRLELRNTELDLSAWHSADTVNRYSSVLSRTMIMAETGVDRFQFKIGGVQSSVSEYDFVTTQCDNLGVFVDSVHAWSTRRPYNDVKLQFPVRHVVDSTHSVGSLRISTTPVQAISSSPQVSRLYIRTSEKPETGPIRVLDLATTSFGKVLFNDARESWHSRVPEGISLSDNHFLSLRPSQLKQYAFAYDLLPKTNTALFVISSLTSTQMDTIARADHNGCIYANWGPNGEPGGNVFDDIEYDYKTYSSLSGARTTLWSYSSANDCLSKEKNIFEAVSVVDLTKVISSGFTLLAVRRDKVDPVIRDAQQSHDGNILITTTLGVTAMHLATKDTLFHIPVRNIRAAVQLTDSVIVTSAGAIFRTDTGWATGWRIGYQDFLRLYPVSRSAVLVIRSSADSIGTVFDVQTGEVLRHLGKGYGVTTAADFDPVRGRLYLGSANGILGVWDLSEFLDSTSTSTQLDDATLLRPNVSFANGTISVNNLETNAVIDVYTYHGQLLSRSSATPFDVHNITLSPDFTTGVVYVVVRTAEGTSAHPIVVYR